MNKEKEIKMFRKFLVKFFNMNIKQKNRIISKALKENTEFYLFLNKIKNFNKEEQENLLKQYDNPEVNSWL